MMVPQTDERAANRDPCAGAIPASCPRLAVARSIAEVIPEAPERRIPPPRRSVLSPIAKHSPERSTQ